MKKGLKFLFAILAMLMVTISPIYSATPTFEGKYVNGVSNCTIYIDYSSGAGYWESYYVNAANNWESPGWSNPINLTFVSSNYGSKIDFILDEGSLWSDVGYVVFAETIFYYNGMEFNPNYSSSNWSFVEIYINDYEFRQTSFSNEDALSTVIHEMGHAFGLAHSSNNYSIMYDDHSARRVYRVQKEDNDAVVAKYQ